MPLVPNVQEARAAAAAACNPTSVHQRQRQRRQHQGISNGSSVRLTERPQLASDGQMPQHAQTHSRMPQHAQHDNGDLDQPALSSSSGRVLLVPRQALQQPQSTHSIGVASATHSQELYQDAAVNSQQQDAYTASDAGMFMWT